MAWEDGTYRRETPKVGRNDPALVAVGRNIRSVVGIAIASYSTYYDKCCHGVLGGQLMKKVGLYTIIDYKKLW